MDEAGPEAVLRHHPRALATEKKHSITGQPNRADAEIEALDDMLVSLGATKLMAERLMQDFPQHATACQAIVDVAADGEGDIRAQSRSSTSSGRGSTSRAARREWWRLSRAGQRNPRVSS
jgi:hypothetical protein